MSDDWCDFCEEEHYDTCDELKYEKAFWNELNLIVFWALVTKALDIATYDYDYKKLDEKDC